MAKNDIEEILEKYRIKNYNKEKIMEDNGKIIYYSKEKHIREIDLLHQKIFKSTNKNDTNQSINQKPTSQLIKRPTNQRSENYNERTNMRTLIRNILTRIKTVVLEVYIKSWKWETNKETKLK